ncbi:unnamed protein product [Cylicocyclus nassatus]|uniref:Uncharacterized protein n=1 Tax=Cylicocyclus nassatus TaxID=53992 RepID=A0AA36M0J7_CYLNA|nr:unnamed protein product [Cylicocyclus nassatus]
MISGQFSLDITTIFGDQGCGRPMKRRAGRSIAEATSAVAAGPTRGLISLGSRLAQIFQKSCFIHYWATRASR